MNTSISNTIYKTTRGFEKVVDGIALTFVNGLGNIIQATGNVSETIDKFLYASLKDIDNRLNKPKTDFQQR